MILKQLPILKHFTDSLRKRGGHAHRRGLLLARAGWIVLALLLLANFVASLPAYYKILRTVCISSVQVQCTFWQLTPGNVEALHRLHLSVETYAAYFVTLDAAVSLLFWVVGILIFWRKSSEWTGLFVSLVLILFGSTGISDTLLVLQRHLISSSRGSDGHLCSLQDLQDASPPSLFAPALIATGHRLPGSEAFGKLAPRRTRPHDPQDAFHDQTMLDGGTTGSGFLGQDRAQLFP